MRLTLGNRFLMMLTTDRYSGRNCAAVVEPSTPLNTILSGALDPVVQGDVIGELQRLLFGSAHPNCAISIPLTCQRASSTTFSKPAENHSYVV